MNCFFFSREYSTSFDRYNERVNSSSSARTYALSGYERETWIDPARNVAEVVGGERGQKSSRLEATELQAAVMFETAGGLGAKLNNTHIMGGERVKELDFFVASIETPVLNRRYFNFILILTIY